MYISVVEYWSKRCDIIGTFSERKDAELSVKDFLLNNQEENQEIFNIIIFKSTLDSKENFIIKIFDYEKIEGIVKSFERVIL